jgi:hypothetical protein
MPQEVCLANSMRQAQVSIPNQPRGSGGAQWPVKIPQFLYAQSASAKPIRLAVTLPVGGDLVISFRRTNVNPQADVNVKISRDVNGVHVTNTPTHAITLSASIQQSGPAENEQVIVTLKGAE